MLSEEVQKKPKFENGLSLILFLSHFLKYIRVSRMQNLHFMSLAKMNLAIHPGRELLL